MKIIIAPDSFKESLSATEVSFAIASGVLQAMSDAQIDLCPLADGGEGLVEAVVNATGGCTLGVDVFDPLGAPIRAKIGLVGTNRAGATLPGELGLRGAMSEIKTISADEITPGEYHTAVIEMASASGLALLSHSQRDPMRTTTFGTGGLITAAVQAGVKEIIIGIGGSATCDGGAGCAQALGVTFIDKNGELCVCGLSGGSIGDIATIDLSDRDTRLDDVRLRVACDVTNVLTGSEGAAAIFGPQKGATPEMVSQLDANLKHFANLIHQQLGIEVDTISGAGAAGGLGAGLVAFAGGILEPGLKLVAESVGLYRRMKGADLCITGEGKLDASSAFGKAAVGVAKIARQHDVPTICIAGQVEDGAPKELFADIRPLVSGEITTKEAMRNPAELLKRRAFEAVRAIIDQQ